MKRGALIEDLLIERLGYKGVGIATLSNGKKVLIKGALPDSTVDAKVIKSKKDYLQAEVVEVKQVADKRTNGTVRCPHYQFPYRQDSPDVAEHKRGCGGCKRQVVDYEQQLHLKEQIVADCFRKVNKQLPKLPLQSVLPAPSPYHYRNKIEFSFGKFLKRNRHDDGSKADGFAIAEHRNLGYHKLGEFSKIVDVDKCYLASAKIHRIFARLKLLCQASELPVYDPVPQEGFFKHLVLREGSRTGQLLVMLSVGSDYLGDNKTAQADWESLLETIGQDKLLREQVTTFLLAHNNGQGDAVKTDETELETVRGPGVIFEELHIGDQVSRFQISPFSFFQTNTLGAELLFATAIDLLPSRPETVIDLYCGGGTIGISLLQRGIGERLIGIDVVPSAIADAQKNAEINKCSQETTFFMGKTERLLREKLADISLKPTDLIVVDPPREGLHPHATHFLIDLGEEQPYTLLYISCNPVTMARDMQLFLEKGFYVEILQPVDLFPQTYHIEMIALIFKK